MVGPWSDLHAALALPPPEPAISIGPWSDLHVAQALSSPPEPTSSIGPWSNLVVLPAYTSSRWLLVDGVWKPTVTTIF